MYMFVPVHTCTCVCLPVSAHMYVMVVCLYAHMLCVSVSFNAHACVVVPMCAHTCLSVCIHVCRCVCLWEYVCECACTCFCDCDCVLDWDSLKSTLSGGHPNSSRSRLPWSLSLMLWIVDGTGTCFLWTLSRSILYISSTRKIPGSTLKWRQRKKKQIGPTPLHSACVWSRTGCMTDSKVSLTWLVWGTSLIHAVPREKLRQQVKSLWEWGSIAQP